MLLNGAFVPELSDLGALEPGLKIVPLSRALTDGSYAAPVRRSIALRLACGWYDPQQVVPALVQGLQDADGSVSGAAAESLKRIDPAASARLGLK